MRCPTCHREVRDETRYRPFCSERCKLLDLGKWLDGSYAIPGEEAAEEELEADRIESEDTGNRRR